MTINQAHTLFLEYGRAERQYAAETLAKQKDCFRSWILPHLGQLPLEDVSRMDILDLRGKMIDRGLGANRQYSILMVLKLFFKFCRTVLKLPCLDPDTEIKLPVRPKPNVQYLTNEEIARVRAVLPPTGFNKLRMRTLIEVLLGTGLRISEALALDRSSFEMGESKLRIVGKGGKMRTVFFPPEALYWIKKFLYYRSDQADALYITTGVPRRLHREDMSKFFKRVKMEANLSKPFTPHILRHTYCTNLLHNGADITFIKELAGHQDIQTTAKYYLGVDEKSLQDVVTKHLNYNSPSLLDGQQASI